MISIKMNAPHTKTEEEKTHFFDTLGPLVSFMY